MKKVAFIIPYFGTLPDYFREWKYTASFLVESVDFIVFTDDANNEMLKNVSSNIIIKTMTFEMFKEIVQGKFDFSIKIPNPYKICDYRPAYGFIFDEILNPYEFWGNCDFDQIWGNFRRFINSELLESYEKILNLGHFSLHKNSERMKTMLRLIMIRYTQILL